MRNKKLITVMNRLSSKSILSANAQKHLKGGSEPPPAPEDPPKAGGN